MEKLSTENERLCQDIETEKSSGRALIAQNALLTKRLDDARSAGVSTVEAYQNALAGFRGVTSALPYDASAYGLFTWFKENFLKLPEFVGGAVDFGTLSCATNLSKTLGKAGCSHFTSLGGRKNFEGPPDLGDSSPEVVKSIKNFMKYFWFKFGRNDARAMAEACWVAVSFYYKVFFNSFDIYLFVFLFLFLSCFDLWQELEKAGGPHGDAIAQSSKEGEVVAPRTSSSTLVAAAPAGGPSARLAPEV